MSKRILAVVIVLLSICFTGGEARAQVNLSPSVSLTAPYYGAAYASPANVMISAAASDGDGSISRVDFFLNNVQVGTTAFAPYSIIIPNLPNGNYTVSAFALDNAGAIASTRTIPITVYTPGQLVNSQTGFGATSYTVNEASATLGIKVQRTGAINTAASVDYAAFDNPSTIQANGQIANQCAATGNFALQKCDYTVAEGTIVFAPGEREKTITLGINNDTYREGAETFLVALSNAVGTVLDPLAGVATITINDDDTGNNSAAINPINDTTFFVRQQYLDFLAREPDAPGLAFWTGEITKCGADAACVDRQRTNTSGAFFLSAEFQSTGFFIYRLYRGSYNRRPSYAEFVPDLRQLAAGIVANDRLQPAVIAANKIAFANLFIARPEFLARYGGLSNDQYVDSLFATTGVAPTLTERNALLVGLDAGAETRAGVLLKIADGTQTAADGAILFTTRYGRLFYESQFNAAFVTTEYFGYLRRDPDEGGYQFWLNKLNFYGNFTDAEMARSFLISDEYVSRYGAR